jgi:hypothetical protein
MVQFKVRMILGIRMLFFKVDVLFQVDHIIIKLRAPDFKVPNLILRAELVSTTIDD